MPRALWKGSISFGLVNIPIELHTAGRDHRPKFRTLHAKDKSPVRFERVCIRDGHPVAWEDLVKGYEYAKGHFAVVTKAVLRRRRSRKRGRSTSSTSSRQTRSTTAFSRRPTISFPPR